MEELWCRIAERGHLEKDEYRGWYCVPDETFLPESQTEVGEDGTRTSLESGRPVEWISEENYVFHLGRFRARIREWLDGGGIIKPGLFRGQVSSLLSEDSLSRLSVSRPRSRLRWGVPVPGDPDQVVYVWLDALANYITVARRGDGGPSWPADVHLVGKDIVKFHAVYWPAFLMAADLPLPKAIRVHSHWTVDGEKMSKTLGNVVCPTSLAERFTGEGLRYFLLREGVPHSDGNYSERKMANYLNAELANTLGNLLSRCTAKSFKDVSLVVSDDAVTSHSSDSAKELLQKLRTLSWKVEQHFLEFEYYLGVDLVMEVLRDTNGYVQEEKPWELRKRPGRSAQERLSVVLRLAFESLRVCSILMQPIVPQLSTRVLDALGVEGRMWEDASLVAFQKEPKVSNEKIVLFRRVETAE